MKRCIFKIYRADIKKIFTNWVSMIILGGLILLPSLYAWVNILASWDPYGNTKGVKVAIVNEDKGGEVGSKTVNVGEELTNTLKENKKLGWTFYTSREDGIAAVNEGKVYATIVIPEAFSREIVTVIDPNPIKPKLEYYVNEKINAIAPKMTDSGASTLQREISTSFIEAATEKVFDILHDAGIELEKEYPTLDKYKNMLFTFNDNMPQMSDKLTRLEDKVNNGIVKIDEKQEDIVFVQDMLNNMSVFVDGVERDLLGVDERLKKEAPEISENLMLLESIFGDISRTTDELSRDIVTGKPEYINKLDRAYENIGSLENKLDNFSDQIESIDKDLAQNIKIKVKEIKSSLNQYSELLREIRSNINNVDKVTKLLRDLSGLNEKISNDIGEMKGLINKSFTGLESTIQAASKICKDLSDIIANINKVGSVGTKVQAQIDSLIQAIDSLQKNLPSNTGIFGQLSNQLQGMKDTLQNLKDALNTPDQSGQSGAMIDKILAQLQNQLLAISTSLDGLRNTVILVQNNVMTGLDQIQVTFKEVSSFTREVSQDIDYYKAKVSKELKDISNNLEDAGIVLGKTSKKLTKEMNVFGEGIQSIVNVLTRDLEDAQVLTTKVQGVLEDEIAVEKILGEFSILMGNMQRLTERMDGSLDTILIPKVETFVTRGSLLSEDIKTTLGKLNSDLDSAKEVVNSISEKGEIALEDVQKLKNNVPEIEAKLSNLTEKIKKIDTNLNVKDLIEMFTGDNNERVDFFAYPVELQTHKIFPMANYGAAMTPFYSTLSLWVGALLLSALLTTKAKNVDFEYNSVQEFFGKYLLFASAAFLQGLIVALGDVFILKVEMQEPLLFIALTPFYSVIFMMIVYTCVSLFGNVGKAMGVILLVLQLAASGGTFPIQVTPQFFQQINSLLPFTYAISGMREAIAGVVYHTLAKDLGILVIFFIIFMIIGVLLKKLANKFLAGFQHKLGESGVIEH